MKIKILGTESLGVRGLSCAVEIHDRNILIDPGVALGYQRHDLLPHPFQIAVGKVMRRKIVMALKDCTDIVISHYHGDHIPMVNANPYQLSAREVFRYFQNPRLWCKSSKGISPAMANRYSDLSLVLGRKLACAEGQSDGLLSFSQSMPHGDANTSLGTVMMTRVEDEQEIFVHASDIQLLNNAPIEQILAWKPDIVLASGPPLYLQHLSSQKRTRARENALLLAGEIPSLILDHHMLRNEEGFRFLEDLSSSAGHRIFCAADYMGCKRLPLEAWRPLLYSEMPVPDGWHKAYSQGKVDTDQYEKWRGIDIQDMIF